MSMQKKWRRLLCVLMIVVFGIGLIQINPLPIKAAVSKEIVKMLKGKWDQGGGRYDGYKSGYSKYAIFTDKYIKWYSDGKFSYKDKIVKAVKKSKTKYVLKMKTTKGIKYRYYAYVKDGRFDSLVYYFDWSGNRISGTSSLNRAVEESKTKSPKLSKTNITLLVSKTTTLKTVGKIQNVKWTSKNKKIAKVSKKGKITAKKKGKTTIVATVKYKSGKKTKTKKLKCVVRVVDKFTLNEMHKAVEQYLKKHYKQFVCSSDEDQEKDGQYIFTIRSTAETQANVLAGILIVNPKTGIGIFEPDYGEKEKWKLM